MSIETKYRNIFGQLLTPQQIQLFKDDYHEEKYVDGKLKQIDEYDNNEVTNGTYYLSQGENLEDILTQFQNIWNTSHIFLDSQTQGEYTIRYWETYKGLVKIFKGKTVYNTTGQEIATQYLDINDFQVLKTDKIYYLTTFGRFNNNDDVMDYGIINFYYNYPGVPSGTIRVIINLPAYNYKEYYVNNEQNILLDPLIAEVFSWDDETYYHSDTPFIPST